MRHKTKILIVGIVVSLAFLGYFIYTLFHFDGPLNVNSATVGQLCLLPGVGAAQAKTIVAKRVELGGFATHEQFQAASGLDAGTLRKFEKHFKLDGPTTFGRVIYKMGSTFSQTKWGWLIVALVVHLFSFVLRAWRWQVLLKPVKHVGFWQSFNPVVIGFMCNTVLPGRVGEVARPAVFAAKEKVSFSASFATVVLERVFDMLAVVAVLGIVVMFLDVPAAEPSAIGSASVTNLAASRLAQLTKYGKLFGPAAFAAIAVFFVVGARPQTAERIMKSCTRFFPHKIQDKLIEFFDKFIVGLQSLESKRDVAWLLFWTVLVWFNIILVYYTVAQSYSIPLSLMGACLCFVLAAAAVAAPQAPGFIGPFQVAVQFGLAMLQVDATAAASYAIMLWVVSMVPTVMLGFVCMALGGISFRDVRQAGEREGAAEEG